MAAHRHDLPPGRIGESWDVADHPRGMSVVAEGPWAGRTLRHLMEQFREDLVGSTWKEREFPLLVKLIDAQDRLSIQVHPDDRLAVELGVGTRGKTECWLFLQDGGEVFVGLKPGVTEQDLDAALAQDRVVDCLNRFEAKKGDFFFIPARTVHALGKGCLIYEVQQTCDVTFRVHDWGRLGSDGKPRQLHVAEARATIALGGDTVQPVRVPQERHHLTTVITCPYFSVAHGIGKDFRGSTEGGPIILTILEGTAVVDTDDGCCALSSCQTALIPAAAGTWSVRSQEGDLRLLVSRPA